MPILRRLSIALGISLALSCSLCCSDDQDKAPRSEPHRLMGLWKAQNEDYTLEAEFYQDGTFYYFYSDDSEQREGSGAWKLEEGKYLLEVDSGMLYLCSVTFDEEGGMTIETESAGTWEFKSDQ